MSKKTPLSCSVRLQQINWRKIHVTCSMIAALTLQTFSTFHNFIELSARCSNENCFTFRTYVFISCVYNTMEVSTKTPFFRPSMICYELIVFNSIAWIRLHFNSIFWSGFHFTSKFRFYEVDNCRHNGRTGERERVGRKEKRKSKMGFKPNQTNVQHRHRNIFQHCALCVLVLQLR